MNFAKTIVLAMTAAITASGAAHSQGYPEQDITLIVGYSAGGGTDVMARTIAPYLEQYLGNDVSVTVENRPGASGELGFTAIAEAAPDGYTIGILNIPAFINPIIQRDPNYTTESFAPIANLVSDGATLVVRSDSEFQELSDFVAYVQENPGVMPIGNSALGGSMHISLLRFLTANELEVTHVPFPGAAPSRTALLGGHVAAAVMGVGEASSYVTEGSLRALGVMRGGRWEEMPDIPTFGELGYDVVSGSDRGLGAPAGIPDEARDALASAIEQILADEAFQEEARNQGLPLNYMSSEDYSAHINATMTEMQQIWDTTPWVQ